MVGWYVENAVSNKITVRIKRITNVNLLIQRVYANKVRKTPTAMPKDGTKIKSWIPGRVKIATQRQNTEKILIRPNDTAIFPNKDALSAKTAMAINLKHVMSDK